MSTALAARIVEHARRTPGRVMVRAGDGELTAAELIGAADAVGRELWSSGGGADRLVALLLPRGLPLGIATLGCYLHGLAYVPLDPAHPREHVRAILDRADPAVVIVDDAAPPRDDRIPFRVLTTRPGGVTLDGRELMDGAVDAAAASQVPPDVGAGAAAYVCFTSGSSGTPKGVVVDRAALENYVDWAARLLPSNGGGAPLFSSPAFDHSVTCLYVPWAHGECVTMIEDNTDPFALCRSLVPAAERFSFIKITPSHLRLVEAAGGIDYARATDALLVGGEAFPTSVVAGIRQRNPALRVINHYGPTEATVGCCAYELPPGRVNEDRPMPIGRAIDGMTAEIDPTGIDPNGVGGPGAGELVVAGMGVARGYLGDPARTAEVFDVRTDGVRRYRTGDLAHRDADGNLYHLGRVDRQVKIDGVRVECGAIEAALARLDGVHHAHATVVAGGSGPRLVAYVVAAGPDVPDGAALRARLADAVPAALVPTAIRLVDRIPVTVNGKVDTSPFDAAPGTPATAPGVAVLDVVQAELADLLGTPVAEIDPATGLFQLGASSMTLSLLLVRLVDRLGCDLRMRDLMEARNVRGLATAAAARPAVAVGNPNAGCQDWTPLTPPELVIWNFGLFRRSAPYLHCSAVFRIADRETARTFAHALAMAAAKHPETKRRFSSPAGVPSSTRSEGPHVEVVDDDRGLAGLRAWFAEPFALRRGRTARVVTGWDGSGAHVGLFVHHLVSDGVSQDLLVRTAAEFWHDGLPAEDAEFAGVDRRPPLLGPRIEGDVRWGDAVDMAIGAEPCDRWRADAREHDVSLFELILTGLLNAMARTGRFAAVAPYVMVSGRQTAADWRSVGCFARGVALDPVRAGSNVALPDVAVAVRTAHTRPIVVEHTEHPDDVISVLFQLEEPASPVQAGLQRVGLFQSSGIGPLGPTDLHIHLFHNEDRIEGQAVFDPGRIPVDGVRNLIDAFVASSGAGR